MRAKRQLREGRCLMTLRRYAVLSICAVAMFLLSSAIAAHANTPMPKRVSLPRAQRSSANCDALTPSPVVTTTFRIYQQKCYYDATPFRITDTRADQIYSDKESYETRSVTVYRAQASGAWRSNQPVVFFVHGGAWVDGYAEWYAAGANSFTGEKGWVTIVLDYRLTSDQVFLADASCATRATCTKDPAKKAAWYPDNIADVANGYQWVLANIADWGGDPSRVFLFGHSAGGHLVSLLMTHPNYAALRPKMRGVISMSGAYLIAYMPLVFASEVSQTWKGTDPAEMADASPINHVIAGMNLPALYLLRAETELPTLNTQTEAFRGKLALSNLPYRYDVLYGYDHTSEMLAIQDISATPTQLIVNFIQSLSGYQIHLPLVTK